MLSSMIKNVHYSFQSVKLKTAYKKNKNVNDYGDGFQRSQDQNFEFFADVYVSLCL